MNQSGGVPAQNLRGLEFGMIYATTSVWFTVIVLLAWGVHHLWSGILKPKTVNGILLPGTLIAQLGHVVGLLITGATVNNTALIGDGDSGEPSTGPSVRPKIPVIGPVVVALLPMLALGLAMFVVAIKLGRPVVAAMSSEGVPAELPASLAGFWEQLRGLITLAEETLDAVRNADAAYWKTALFAYLMVCFAVRMAPHPGNARGHIGAIVAVGIVAALAGTLSPQPAAWIEEAWPILSLTTGWLLLLMMISLLARGTVTTIQLIARTA